MRLAHGVLLIALAQPACGIFGQDAKSVEHSIVGDAKTVANGARVTIENAETTALLVYRMEQFSAVQQSESREEAKAAVEKIRAKWDGRWDVFERARKAHALLVLAIEAYEASQEIDLPSGKRVPTVADVIKLSGDVTALYTTIAQMVSEARGTR